MLHGEFESMRLINSLIPVFCPKPLAWGKCTDSNFHYLLFPFHELKKGPPDTGRLSQAVAQLHNRSIEHNPTGKWGFHMTTYNGPLAQDNTWTDTWEEHWIRAMRQLFALERASRGPSEELDRLLTPYFEKVCPRLLRPLETNGRHIKPVLVHGDLWIGNMAVQADTEDPLMFDSAAFWGHNECKINQPPHPNIASTYLIRNADISLR
jgi:protein-ribulosamine 3-kinase